MKTRILLSGLAVGCLLAPAAAQIPNGGFENWITPPGASYQDPVGWITFNALTTLEGGQPSCSQGTPGVVGNYYATVTTRGTAFGPIQGIINYGDATTGSTGFAYSSRPAAFTGQWKYSIAQGDSGMVAVYFTKWNTATQLAEPIGGVVALVSGTQNSWTALNQAIQYQSTANPDTAYVIIASSTNNAVAGSTISVDDLSFGSSTAGIAEEPATAIRMYPSPATNVLNLVSDKQVAEVDVLDMTGRTVLNQGAFSKSATLNLEDLNSGRYMVQLRMADGTRNVRSFVKQ